MQIGYDYSDFDPEKGGYNSYMPEPGNYTITLLNGQSKEVEGKGSLIELEMHTHGDDQTFTLSYLTGWKVGDYLKVRQIAYEELGRLYYGITGNKPPQNGFNLSDLYNGSFNADLQHRPDKRDPDKKYLELKNIKPLDSQPQPATSAASSQGAQVSGKPAWAQ